MRDGMIRCMAGWIRYAYVIESVRPIPKRDDRGGIQAKSDCARITNPRTQARRRVECIPEGMRRSDTGALADEAS